MTIQLDRTYTIAEFEALPEFDGRYELIEGRLLEKPVPGHEHSKIARRLIKAYDRFDPAEQAAEMLQEVSTRLGTNNTPIPDVAFWMAAHRPEPTRKAAPRPDLAIEIWSPSDIQNPSSLEAARAKVRRYQVAGVPLIWAINPASQTVEVYHKEMLEPLVLTIADTLDGEDILPGFRLPLAALFTPRFLFYQAQATWLLSSRM